MIPRLWWWCMLAVFLSISVHHTVVADDDLEVITINTEDEEITDEDLPEEMLASTPSSIIISTSPVTDLPTSTPPTGNATESVQGRTGSRQTTDPNRPVRTCGVPFKGPDRLVVGGQNADPYEYPWMAALLTRHDRVHFCGGSLITDRHVLTAAHCFDRKNPTNIIVRLGEYNIYRNNGHIDYRVYNLKIHPKYMTKTGAENTFRNDIAVVFTYGIAPYNSAIRPICLPPRGLDYTGQRAVATGWGRIDNNNNWAHILQEVTLPIWRTESCNDRHVYNILSNQELCAGPEQGLKDTCDGDSGGPLALPIRGRWSLVGIVSWGPTQCGSKGLPGVYTRVDAFLHWIIATVRGN